MKRVFGLGLTVTMLVALTFTNCTKDEEYEPMKAGVLNEKTGLRVAQCASPLGGGYKFFYKSNGWIEQVEVTCADGTSEAYDFSYNPNKMAMTLYDEQGYPEITDDIAVNYNKNGYLSDIEYIIKQSGEIENIEFDGIGNMAKSYSYDGNGHLIGIKAIMKMEFEYKESGIKMEVVEEGIFTLTWNDDKLQKITYKDNETTTISGGTLTKEKKTSTNETSTMTFAYSNSTKNIWGQWAQSLALLFAIEEDESEMFAYVGLLGKGSSALPSKATYACKIVETLETGKKTSSEDTQTFNFAHTLNKGNAIYSTTINDVVYKFGYDYAEVALAKSIVGGNELRSGARFMKRNLQSKLRKF